MKIIPKNCIKKFKELFNVHPSVLELKPIRNVELVNKFFSKSRVVWRHEVYKEINEIRTYYKLLEYDPAGVMVYIYDEVNIFILTTEDRMDVAKLTISRLKKLIRDENGNNS